MTEVRLAGPQDWDEIFRLLRLAHDESGLFEFDLAKVEWWVRRMLWPEQIAPTDTCPRGVIGVIGEPGHLEGLAFIIIGTIWYSAKPHLEELTVYVEPEYRPQRHVLALIEWMKEQSRVSGLPLMSGILSPKGVSFRKERVSSDFKENNNSPAAAWKRDKRGIVEKDEDPDRTEAKVRLYAREMGKPAGAVFKFDPITAGSTISLRVH